MPESFAFLKFKMYNYSEFRINQISDFLASQLYKCSLKNRGYLWQWFKYHKECKKTKVVICFHLKKVVGWGVIFKYSPKREIMLFVDKKYRRLGIGSAIYKKLSYKIAKKRIRIYKDVSNKQFFKSLNCET